MKSAVGFLSDDLARQMSYVYLAFQLVSVFATTIFSTPLIHWLEKTFPPAKHEELSQPQYLYDQAIGEPQSALDLVEKEQLRVMKFLPDYLNRVRKDPGQSSIEFEVLQKSSQTLLKRIDLFLMDLMNQVPSRDSLERGIHIQNRNGLILSLSETLAEWVRSNAPFLNTPKLSDLIYSLSEALHFILISLEDTMQSLDPEDLKILLRLTEDRGQMMEEMRKKRFSEEEAFSYENQQAIYSMTSLFERSVWLVRRIVLLLPGDELSFVHPPLTNP